MKIFLELGLGDVKYWLLFIWKLDEFLFRGRMLWYLKVEMEFGFFGLGLVIFEKIKIYI